MFVSLYSKNYMVIQPWKYRYDEYYELVVNRELLPFSIMSLSNHSVLNYMRLIFGGTSPSPHV